MKITPKRLIRILGLVILFVVVITLINQVFPEMALSFVSAKSLVKDSHERILLIRENNNQAVRSLEHQIDDLKQILEKKTKQLVKMKVMNENNEEIQEVSNEMDMILDGDSMLHYVQKQVNKATILKSSGRKNEYDINQFDMFDRNFIYKLDLGLKLRPQDILSSRKDWSEEFHEVILEGVKRLNKGTERQQVSPTYRFTIEDFVHGLFRVETNIGTQYILVYKPVSNQNIIDNNQLFQVTIFRPFAPVQTVFLQSAKSSEKIHFIVPLQERQDAFRIFLEYFKDFAISDGNVQLILIYYGEEGFNDFQNSLNVLQNQTGFKEVYIDHVLNEEFSRGRALQRGTKLIKNDDALMFFCDVDIGFTAEFLNQCRAHASEGKSVFYPIVFSLFNPSLVYRNEAIPALRDRQILKRDNGLWRDFGFGMSCQYLSDFRRIGGFDLSIHGWGYEDTLLYRKYSQSDKLMVIRTPVNSLFHHWHPKHCDKSWSKEQYESCLRSKARTEGSQTTLGLLYFELKEKLAQGN